MQTMEERVTRETPQRHRRLPLLAILLLVALAITLAGIFPFRQMIAQNRQVQQTQAQYQMLVEENAYLENQIVVLQTPLEVERLAREEYGLVRPGETGYKVVPAPGVDVAPGEPAVVPDRPIWQRFWDFLTGRDLVPDE